MAFTKGHKLAKGRPKGSPNKTTVAAKEAIQAAFDGLGGVDALIEWATQEKNRGLFYSSIYPRILPHEVTGKDGGAVELVHQYAIPTMRKIEG